MSHRMEQGDSEPLVSVVTPMLDPDQTKLRRCLESVESQGFSPLEHVIIDGGSSQDVLAIVEGRERVKLLSEPDEGQSDALNKGFFGLADGEILVWLNSDDVLLPGALHAIVDAFRSNPEAGWVYGNLDVNDRGAKRTIVPPHPATMADLDFNNECLIAPGSALTRWALDRAGPLNNDFKLEMDFDLAIRMMKLGIRPAYVPRSLALFELEDDTKSGSTSKSNMVEERHRIYLSNGMFQQAGAALALAGRYELLDLIADALREGDFSEASRLARTGLRFMPSIFERHRISFLLTMVSPRLVRAIKSRKGNLKPQGERRNDTQDLDTRNPAN